MMNYTNKVRKSRFKKGQPKRFRSGNLVKISAPRKEFLGDLVALWSSHPRYDNNGGVVSWGGEIHVCFHVKKRDILLVIDVHNFAYPSKHQYCRVMCFHTNESGWVSSEFLEKL